MHNHNVRPRVALFGLIIFAALIFVLGCTDTRAQPATPSDIVGFLVVRVRDARENIVQIRLADRKVMLRNAAGASVSSAPTGLDGRFELSAPTPGNYQICWDVGPGATGCQPPLTASGRPIWAGNVAISPERPVVFGSVLTGDGRACWINDPYFRASAVTKVAGGGVAVDREFGR